ncbi:MAG: recombinase family protein [Selenomonadaceae bacterium]|nr:recombinase family protein [Selenomonadaceae bacterium]
MKIAIYGKTNGQNDIDAQVQQCREYAEQKNYEIANEFIDDLDTDGRSFEQLIEAAADFDGVVIKDRARLSRDAMEYELKMKALREAKLQTFFVTE